MGRFLNLSPTPKIIGDFGKEIHSHLSYSITQQYIKNKHNLDMRKLDKVNLVTTTYPLSRFTLVHPLWNSYMDGQPLQNYANKDAKHLLYAHSVFPQLKHKIMSSHAQIMMHNPIGVLAYFLSWPAYENHTLPGTS
jgi:hypothetical protein